MAAASGGQYPGTMNLEDRWKGGFGDAYTERNRPAEEVIAQTAAALAGIWQHMTPPPGTVLEVGANAGRNIHALQRITTARLQAVEPNPTARKELSEVLDAVHDATAGALPFADDSMDLVFTSGVLIHIPNDALGQALDEIHRVAHGWVLSIEYFSPTPQTIDYRGQGDMLFKRDYGSLWLDRFDDLEHVANGFQWRRTTGQDNNNWWLFRKLRGRS